MNIYRLIIEIEADDCDNEETITSADAEDILKVCEEVVAKKGYSLYDSRTEKEEV